MTSLVNCDEKPNHVTQTPLWISLIDLNRAIHTFDHCSFLMICRAANYSNLLQICK